MQYQAARKNNLLIDSMAATQAQIINKVFSNFYKELSFSPFSGTTSENLTLLKTGIQSPYFNFIFASDSFSKENIQETLLFFEGLSCEWTVNYESMEGFNLLRENGFTEGDQSFGMVLSLENFDSYIPRPDTIKVLPVTDESFLKWWVNIGAITFRLPKQDFKNFFYPIFKLRGDNFRFNICFLEERVASISLLFLQGDLATISALATLPKFQNKGAGFYTLHESLSYAKQQGVKKVAVQSTLKGKSLYQKLGFEEVCKFQAFMKTQPFSQ